MLKVSKHLDFCFTLCNGKPINKFSVNSEKKSKMSAPSFPEPPIIDGDVHSNRIEPLGGNAILNCEVRGDPLPIIRWSKKGINVPISNRIRQLDNGSLAIYGTVVQTLLQTIKKSLDVCLFRISLSTMIS